MANFLKVLQIIIQLLPVIEALIPQSGKGAVKKALMVDAIESAGLKPNESHLLFIDKAVARLNDAGVFTKAA